MPLVLAIEPDLRQAAIIRRVVKQQVHADLVLVDSRDAAVAALKSRVPDVVLITALLSPRDEEELIARLRGLDGADHLQTHTIPQLASSGGEDGRGEGGQGLLGRFRRKKESEPIPGCDPDMFAEEIRAFLQRAAELKAETAAAASRHQQEPIEARPQASEWRTADAAPQPDPSSSWSSPFEWRRSDPPQAAAVEPEEAAAIEAPAIPRQPLVTASPLAVQAEEEEWRRMEAERAKAEAERARLEEERAENERLRRETEAENERRRREAEEAIERLRLEAEAEAERLRAEAEAERQRARAQAEEEAARMRAQVEAEAAAERERLRLEAEALAERERQRLEAEAAAERERQRLEAEAVAAERERLRLEAEAAAAERERRRLEEEAAAAERERLRLEEEAAAAERERLRLEAEAAAAERERLRVEAEVAAERERLRREAEELAAERERIRQAEILALAVQSAEEEHEVEITLDPEEPAADAFADFREDADQERGIFRLMPLAAWTRIDAPAPLRRYASARPQPQDPIEHLALPPHVAGMTYPRGCRIRRVRVPAQTGTPRAKTPHPVILSKRALDETRASR